MDNNALDFDLAKSVGEFFRLDEKQMEIIIVEVLNSVGRWKDLANRIGISKTEQELMEGAFKQLN